MWQAVPPTRGENQFLLNVPDGCDLRPSSAWPPSAWPPSACWLPRPRSPRRVPGGRTCWLPPVPHGPVNQPSAAQHDKGRNPETSDRLTDLGYAQPPRRGDASYREEKAGQRRRPWPHAPGGVASQASGGSHLRCPCQNDAAISLCSH